MFRVLWEVTRSLTRGCAHGVYLYALLSLLKAGIMFSLEEHSQVNIVLNFLSFNFLAGYDHGTFSLVTEVSFSCYT